MGNNGKEYTPSELKQKMAEIIEEIEIFKKEELKPLKTELGKKADSSQVAKIEKVLNNKADSSQVDDIEEMLNDKAENSRVEKIEKILKDKADSKNIADLNNKLDSKVDISSVGQIWTNLAKKADDSELKKLSTDFKELKGMRSFTTCIFLCAILFFNIVAPWIVIYRPGYSELIAVDALPWHFILPLVVIMFVNLSAVIIWGYHLQQAGADYCVWEILDECVLLVFNTVTIWLFAFYPQTELSGAIYALVVFLALANALALIMRIVLFSFLAPYSDTDSDTVDTACLVISILETICLFIILIIFAGWIRL